jgi:DNA-binding NarL/FixJ family response regulator
VRVLVVDDQELVRIGFRLILDAEPDITVVAEAGDGEQAVRAAVECAPDVVLMDIRMPKLDGIEATARITTATAARVLVLTTFDVDDYVYRALRAGASGFLLKDAQRADLVAAVRVVAAGDALLAPTVTRRLIHDLVLRPGAVRAADPRLAALTPRETEILRLVARGLSNSELAAALHLSEHTVKTHVSNILTKLDLRDRVQAVVFAYDTGLAPEG